MSATQRTPAAAAPALPAPVQELVLRAELHANSATEALAHYEAALEALNAHIQGLPAGSEAQAQHIQHFRALLTTAESLKHADPPAAEYAWRQRQAQRLAERAVDADGRGLHGAALELYTKLLECLNRCHALETAPASQAAIMARFQVYLERAETLRGRAR